jgi:hypothetical protein
VEFDDLGVVLIALAILLVLAMAGAAIAGYHEFAAGFLAVVICAGVLVEFLMIVG